MKKATFFTEPFYWGNKIFDSDDPVYAFNGVNAVYPLLKHMFAEYDIDVATQDIHPSEESVFTLFFDMPFKRFLSGSGKKYLLMLESFLARPDNWSNHSGFDKIFTWDDDLVNGERYIKLYYNAGRSSFAEVSPNKEQKLCTLVSTNKHKFHPEELYSERLSAINWFEKHHPDDFEFFGVNWDKRCFNGVLRPLNKISPLAYLLAQRHQCYRGVKSAIDVLPNYKFSICYENIKGFKGYVTEKIFNCFVSGCVPIYWGAPNIDEYVPKEAYIDWGKFKSYEDLYDFIKNMSQNNYKQMLASAKDFVESEAFYKFTPEGVASNIFQTIMNDLQ